MEVFILRGLPASGKTTWVQVLKAMNLHRKVFVCSADMTHTLPDGSYKFDPARIGESHDRCLREFMLAIIPSVMSGGAPDYVVVDNTNTTAWEIAPYYRLAEVYGARPVIKQFTCSVQESIERNVHNVPPEKIWQMSQNLATERLPPHWKIEFVFRSTK